MQEQSRSVFESTSAAPVFPQTQEHRPRRGKDRYNWVYLTLSRGGLLKGLGTSSVWFYKTMFFAE